MSAKMIPTLLHIEPPLRDQIDAIAKAKGMKRAALVRFILRQYAEQCLSISKEDSCEQD